MANISANDFLGGAPPKVVNANDFASGGFKVVTSTEEPAQKTTAPSDFLTKAANIGNTIFPGTKQIGESLVNAGSNIANLATGGVNKFEKNLPNNTVNVPALAGAYGENASTVLGAALPGTSSIVKQAAIMGGLGATAAGGASLANNNSASSAAKDAFVGGITGAAIGATAQVAGKIANKFLNSVPERLYSNALKVSKNLELHGKNPSQYLLKKGFWGTTGQLYKATETGISETNSIIDQKLAADPTHLATSDLLEKVQKNLEDKFGNTVGSANIEQTLQNLPIEALTKNKSISVEDANNIRKELDKLLTDSFFVSNGTPSIGKQALGEVASVLRNTVKDTTGTHAEFNDLSKLITTQKLLKNSIAQADRQFGLGLKDLGFGIFGNTVGGPIGAAATVGAEKLLRSTVGQTGIATALYRLNKLPTDSAGRLSREAVVRLLEEIGKKDEQAPHTLPQ